MSRAPGGRWQARWRDSTGKQHAKRFDRKIDAETHERAMRSAVAGGTDPAPAAAKITVRAWADEWITGARNLSYRGRGTYEEALNGYVLPALGDLPLRRLTAEAIDEFITAELAQGLAPSTVHRHYRTIRRMCNVAVARRRLVVNPCGEVTPPPLERAAMRILTPTEIDALWHVLGERYRAWLHVACYTGIRWSEGVGLRRSRIDGARITVMEQLTLRDGIWTRDKPKSAAGVRSITMSAFLVDELAGHVDRWSLDGPDGLVFPNRAGQPMRSSNFSGMVFKPACVKAGLGQLLVDETTGARTHIGVPRIHDLRHTSAALAIKAGAHPKALQVRMGHTKITTTLDTYGHLFDEMDDQIAVDLDKIRATVRAELEPTPATAPPP